MSPNEILWKLPLADGLWYQREHWLSLGIKLIRRIKRSGKPARSYFRS
jgi:hypothetical protein